MLLRLFSINIVKISVQNNEKDNSNQEEKQACKQDRVVARLLFFRHLALAVVLVRFMMLDNPDIELDELMKIIPAKSRKRVPDTVNPSDIILRFTAILSVKKPFIANTPTVISEATTKQTRYFISNSFFSSLTVSKPSVSYFADCLYFSSSASLQSTKCPGVTSRKEGWSTE